MIAIRFAAFHSALLAVVNVGGKDTNCKFGGIVGGYVNDIVKYGKFNCSVNVAKRSEGHGHLNETTGMFDGVNGIIQRNESDMNVHIIAIPPEQDSFKYAPVVEYSYIAAASSYNLHDSSKINVLDVTSSLSKVQNKIWIVYFVFIFLFWLLFIGGKKFFRRRKTNRSFWTVTTFLFSQSNYDARGLFFCIVVFSFALYNGFIQLFISNFMAAELIQPQLPRVIENFEEILHLMYNPKHGLVDKNSKFAIEPESRQLATKFSRQTHTIKRFKTAPSGSVQKRIYDHSVRVSGKNGLYINLTTLLRTPESFVLDKHFNSLVIVDVEGALIMYRVNVCKILSKMRKVKPSSKIASSSMWYSKERIYFFLGHTYSPHISNSLREYLDVTLLKLAERGINARYHIEKPHTAHQMDASVIDCLRDRIVLGDSQVYSINSSNISFLFSTLLFLYLVAALVLVAENIFSVTHKGSSPNSTRSKRHNERFLGTRNRFTRPITL